MASREVVFPASGSVPPLPTRPTEASPASILSPGRLCLLCEATRALSRDRCCPEHSRVVAPLSTVQLVVAGLLQIYPIAAAILFPMPVKSLDQQRLDGQVLRAEATRRTTARRWPPEHVYADRTGWAPGGHGPGGAWGWGRALLRSGRGRRGGGRHVHGAHGAGGQALGWHRRVVRFLWCDAREVVGLDAGKIGAVGPPISTLGSRHEVALVRTDGGAGDTDGGRGTDREPKIHVGSKKATLDVTAAVHRRLPATLHGPTRTSSAQFPRGIKASGPNRECHQTLLPRLSPRHGDSSRQRCNWSYRSPPVLLPVPCSRLGSEVAKEITWALGSQCRGRAWVRRCCVGGWSGGAGGVVGGRRRWCARGGRRRG
ncbi:LOW QUALITY PROTEIN: hypothetical protein BRADI_2g25078v3 [Brachypodium distachyon]|uniref:Uncharacterized protein n=1 Tax=Brachypodium distachyon TaxID=15368 RepID=A0A2K2DAC3_BRADI|nr:LOW QUALITY PROTEIN: hypothetical protein BRADI_2g25078v3 [Brachypodium distachyon]